VCYLLSNKWQIFVRYPMGNAVQVSTKDKGLKSALENERDCLRHYGAAMCKKLRLRLAALRAAASLADFWPPNSGPERCHELKGDKVGVFSMDLKQPYRLLFSPIEESLPENRSEELVRWSNIKAIELLTVEDTHG
jgi:plasmid maintenance system killer protein